MYHGVLCHLRLSFAVINSVTVNTHVCTPPYAHVNSTLGNFPGLKLQRQNIDRNCQIVLCKDYTIIYFHQHVSPHPHNYLFGKRCVI